MKTERETVLQIIAASTAGDMGYGRISVDVANGLAALTSDSKEVWCSYVRREDGEHVTAITGNGPDSEANAKFFAGARGCCLALIEDLERADRILRDLLLEGPNGRAAAEARERLGISYEPKKHA